MPLLLLPLPLFLNLLFYSKPHHFLTPVAVAPFYRFPPVLPFAFFSSTHPTSTSTVPPVFYYQWPRPRRVALPLTSPTHSAPSPIHRLRVALIGSGPCAHVQLVGRYASLTPPLPPSPAVESG